MTSAVEKTDFEITAERAEEMARSSMFRHKTTLLGYVLLGYSVIFGVLFALFGLLGGLLGVAFYSTALLFAG